MIVVDVNLLLYAIFTGFPEHPTARAWWEGALSGTRDVGISAPAVFGFIRVATNRRAFTEPMTVDQAAGHVREWLDRPVTRYLSSSLRTLDLALGLLDQAGTAGNLTTDAQIAAHALEHDGEVFSNDHDFGRFREVTWTNPLR